VAVELRGDDHGGALVGGLVNWTQNLRVVEPSACPRRPATVLRSVPAARSWVAE